MKSPYDERKDIDADEVELKGVDTGAMGKMVVINCRFDEANANAKIMNDEQRHDVVTKQAPSMFMEYCKMNGVRPREKDIAGNDVPHFEIKQVDKGHYILTAFVVADKAWAVHQIESAKDRIKLDMR